MFSKVAYEKRREIKERTYYTYTYAFNVSTYIRITTIGLTHR